MPQDNNEEEVRASEGFVTTNTTEPETKKPARQRSRRKKPGYLNDPIEREMSPSYASADTHVVNGANGCDLTTNPTNGRKTVQCNICKRFIAESKLANHIRLLHVETIKNTNEPDGRKKQFKCEHCGKHYAIKYTYEQHVKTHIEGRPKCPECGSTFASAFSLFRHRAKNHNLEHNYQVHNCDKCEKSFFSVSELKLHQLRHSSEKGYKCSECEKEFSVKGNLRIHMRTHAKEKLYKCDICSNSFSHPYSLISHRRIHTNDYPFKCVQCDKSYRSKHQLTSHMNVHTDNRPFKCSDCSKTFRSRTAFKMHQDEHLGIKRFVCKFCDRKFQCLANKLKHERRHIGEKKYKCEICEKAFIEKPELKSHLKVHEKNGLKQLGAKHPIKGEFEEVKAETVIQDKEQVAAAERS